MRQIQAPESRCRVQQRHVGDAIVVFDERRVVPLFQARILLLRP